jgi:hypothetical protein
MDGIARRPRGTELPILQAVTADRAPNGSLAVRLDGGSPIALSAQAGALFAALSASHRSSDNGMVGFKTVAKLLDVLSRDMNRRPRGECSIACCAPFVASSRRSPPGQTALLSIAGRAAIESEWSRHTVSARSGNKCCEYRTHIYRRTDRCDGESSVNPDDFVLRAHVHRVT